MTSSATAAPRMMRASLVLDFPEIFQNARGDSDAGRGQRSSDKQVTQPTGVGNQLRGYDVAEHHGRDDAQGRHQQGRPAHRKQLNQIRFHADFEQQQNRADFRQDTQRRAVLQRIEQRDAEQVQIAREQRPSATRLERAAAPGVPSARRRVSRRR